LSGNHSKRRTNAKTDDIVDLHRHLFASSGCIHSAFHSSLIIAIFFIHSLIALSVGTLPLFANIDIS
jgi:hypothetical protein